MFNSVIKYTRHACLLTTTTLLVKLQLWQVGDHLPKISQALALNVGEVKVLDNSECNARYFSEFEFSIIGREVVCTEDEDGKITATTGDSGGPVVVVKNGVSVVIGIIFSGKKGFPNVHTRVSSFYHWITQNTLAKSCQW